MEKRDWNELCGAAFAAQKFLCVGLDPVYEKLPGRYREDGMADQAAPLRTLVAM